MRQTEIAKRADVSPQLICDIFKGRAYPSRTVAKRLESITGISRLAWLYPDEYENPLIKARPVKKESGAA